MDLSCLCAISVNSPDKWNSQNLQIDNDAIIKLETKQDYLFDYCTKGKTLCAQDSLYLS